MVGNLTILLTLDAPNCSMVRFRPMNKPPLGSRYDAFPEHPLCGIDPAILEAARGVLRGAAEWKDVSEDMVEPIADAVVMALLPFLTVSCRHLNVTEPSYTGGNYGNYGTVRCKDCGAWKDDFSDGVSREDHVKNSRP